MPPDAPLQPIHAGEPVRFPTLDAVRFLAFFAVFASHGLRGGISTLVGLAPDGLLPSHAATLYEAGGYGVDLFLVLSAFLITVLLLQEQDATGTLRVGGFYVRRMLRIWPLYLAFLALMFLVDEVWEWGRGGFTPIADGYWVSFLLLVGNWYSGIHGFPEGNISPLWSVSLEEQFYLVWPWLVLLARRRLVLLAGLMLGLSAVSRMAIVFAGLEHTAMAWTFTVTRLDPIALGVLLAVGWRRGLLPRLRPSTQWLLMAGGFLSWPLLYLAFPLSTPMATGLLRFPLVALASAAILLAAVTSTGRLHAALVHPVLVRLGTLSYGTYVVHYAALGLAGVLVATVLPGDAGSAVARPILGFLITWLVAEASYRWLETPFLRLRRRFRAPAMRQPVESTAAPAEAPRQA